MDGGIYLDNNATTRPLESVAAAMTSLLRDEYANPSSVHRFGQQARHKIECAREQVAGLVNADPREIVFTSGGTESINLAIRGILATRPDATHIITSAVEHDAVRNLAIRIAREGRRIDEIDVDSDGRLNFDELAGAITGQTALISIMHANNETGVLFDIERVCDIAARHGVLVHVDAVQSAGKTPIDVKKIPAHLLSISSHKLHGPKGVGALYVRKGVHLAPLLSGGRQERDLRPGTENAPAIVGFGVAAEEAAGWATKGDETIGRLRDEFEARVTATIPAARVIARGATRLCNTSCIGFERLSAEAILISLSERGVYASAGAACGSGALESSHVLAAMGVDSALAHGAVRFSMSRFTTVSEIEQAVEVLSRVIQRVSEKVK